MDTGQWWPNFNTSSGTFKPNELAYGFMEEVLPHTGCVAAKIYNIESSREEWVDYDRVFNILKAADFNGRIAVYYKSTYEKVEDYQQGGKAKDLRIFRLCARGSAFGIIQGDTRQRSPT